MPLTRIDSAFLDLDAIGGIDFDVQSGVPTLSVDATTHRVGIRTPTPTSSLHIAGVGELDINGDVIPDDNRIRIGDYHWDDVYTTIHAKKHSSEWWLEQNSDDDDGVDLIFYKSRGVPGAETPVNLDDNVFRLTGRVYRQDSTRVGSNMTTGDWGGDSLAQIAFDVDAITPTVAYGRIDFRTASQSRMMIKSNGNIGIGTTSPTEVLDIVGNVNISSGSNYLIDGSQISTANVTENVSYLYYTDARSRNAISVTDNGGDGSLSYDSGTGAITYVGPSAAETRAHFSAGTGVSITNGEVAIGQSVGTSDNVTFVNGIFSGNVGIGKTNPTIALDVIGGFNLTGKIIAGDELNNINFSNVLDVTATSGINAYRPINFIDSSASIKLARVTDNLLNDSAVEFQTWDSTLTTNTSYWDVYGGYYGLGFRDRFTGRVSNRLFIGTSGNVLIGSANSNGVLSSTEITTNGVSNILQVQGNSYLSGNVGIGTTNPLQKLDVLYSTIAGNRHFSTYNSNGVRLQRRGDVDGWAFEYGFLSNNGTDLGGFGGFGSSTGITNYYIGVDYQNQYLSVTSTGNVGIGISIPETILHIKSEYPKLRLESTNQLDLSAGAEEIGRIEWEAYKSTNYNVAASIRVRQDGTWSTITPWYSPTAIEFYTQDQSGVEVTSPRLTIKSDGNIGIGTTNPSAKLHVVGGGKLEGYYEITNGFEFQSGDGSLGYGGFTAEDDMTIYGKYDTHLGLVTNPATGSGFVGGIVIESTANRFGHPEVITLNAKTVINGNVGIGTTNPATSFDVYKQAGGTIGGEISIRNDASAANTDVGIHLCPNPGGVVRAASIYSTQESLGNYANLRFFTANGDTPVERLRITSSGNVGIGTTSPLTKLDVVGIGRFTNNSATLQLVGDDHSYIEYYPDGILSGRKCYVGFPAAASNEYTIGNQYQVGGNIKLLPGTNAGVFIGQKINIIPYDTLENGTLSFEGSAGQLFSVTNNLTTGSIFSVNDVSGIPSIDVDADGTVLIAPYGGNVGIGTTSNISLAALQVQFTGDRGIYVKSSDNNSSIWLDAAGASYVRFRQNLVDKYWIVSDSNGHLKFRPNGGTPQTTFLNNGNVGIGTENPTSKLEVVGTITGTTKNFLINHPTQPGRKLRHGSLEGPENAVYIRGRITGSNVIELPEYWTGLVDENTITVSLTPIGVSPSHHFVVDIVNNTVVINSSNGTIDSFYMILGERKDVEKMIVEE